MNENTVQAKRPSEEDGGSNNSASKATRSAVAKAGPSNAREEVVRSPRGVEVPAVGGTPTKIPTDGEMQTEFAADDTMAAADTVGIYKFPNFVRGVLRERITKLQNFPTTDFNYTNGLTRRLEGMLQKDDSDDPDMDRLAADLAIVVSRVAHAQDRHDNDWVDQDTFRQEKWLEEQCSFRAALLRLDSVQSFMAAVQSSHPRPLTCKEKQQLIEWHQKAREPNPPLLDGTKMTEFLNAQTIYFLAGGTGNLRLCGLSSFDGTHVYVVDEDAGSTIPHELEQNLRRYIEVDPHEQARLVSPSKDPTLRIKNSQGESLQCEAGFVMEKKNGRKVPDDLIGPFSARWNRRFLK
ncbi:expressed unknown protein [Seminavis robusta]|uniref:Uncharacterized protein n=1 Tax=Seminavis robusta TaxID=568900 RepID=A0A9N8E9R1_9STRA|nr:expressed unknown protein [Seminavis robusta]|eukprot:Sro853_g211100.1 n/a (350) ;mRNA; f:10917-11966